MNASILINGVFAAKHRCGYTPCTLRIDEFLNYGEENEVQVAIRGSANAPQRRLFQLQTLADRDLSSRLDIKPGCPSGRLPAFAVQDGVYPADR